MLPLPFVINCNGQILDLSTPLVMGILNVNNDSFYDGGFYTSDKNMLVQAEKMLAEGATIIDVGAVSTRPNATHVEEHEELVKIEKSLGLLLKNFPDAVFSVDTFRSKVLKTAVQMGASILNDVSAGCWDDSLLDTLSQYKLPYVLCHAQGTPQTMQQNPSYENIILEVYDFLSNKIQLLRKKGIYDIIIDVGFGFGKTVAHNYELLKNLANFRILECPILVGVSRKSMIYKPLNISSQDALNGTTALHFFALQNGANILRCHDVKAAMQTIKLYQMLQI
jgi:dihydropteroate synthase